ncbi:MAG: ABC-F family ATP-binding cassette domain-containing protein [Silvanigrellaceae bacterium]
MIRIERINKSYGPQVILRDATFHFPAGERIALVGANGAGKTTLLNMICETEECDSGSIIRPRDCVIGYLPQEPNPTPRNTVLQECVEGHRRIRELWHSLEKAQETLVAEGTAAALENFERAQKRFEDAGGLLVESRARGILAGLGFSLEQLEIDPRALSGGWRMRLELAKVFLNDPDFLVLDEPTNHLDLPSLVWVEGYLRNFHGCLLFVSHDRGLLNRLATMTAHISSGQLRVYKGNFDSFLEQKEQAEQQDVARAEAISRRKEELSRFIERFGAKATKARQAQARVKMLARLQALEDDIALPQKESEVAFSLKTPTPSGKEVLRISQMTIGYSVEKPLARNLHLNVIRGQKICVIGANGIGKSTLLETIAGNVQKIVGNCELGYQVTSAYFAQDQMSVLQRGSTVLENVLRRTDLSEKEARALLGNFLFRGDDVFKRVEVLSGGEKNRVGLAILLAQNSNFLILDEPTNHLDMSSAEILSEALQDFEGTILCVSHDREFINSFATHVFVMLPGGRNAIFEGNLDDYPRLAEVSGFPNILDVSTSSGMSPAHSDNADSGSKESRMRLRAVSQQEKRERQSLSRKISEMESRMETIQGRITELEAMLLEVGSNYLEAQKLGTQLADLRGQLEETESLWFSASESLANLDAEGESP